MKLPFFLLTIFLGIILALHLSMNGKVGSELDNARVANAFFWSVGALTAIIVGITGWEAGIFARFGDINPLLFTAGAMGALLVFAIAWLIPRVGAGPIFIILLAGQVLGGLVMSHYGWLGSPREPITLVQIAGALLMVGGAALATLRL